MAPRSALGWEDRWAQGSAQGSAARKARVSELAWERLTGPARVPVMAVVSEAVWVLEKVGALAQWSEQPLAGALG